MQKEKKTRKQLVEKINSAGRKMSTASLVYHQMVAEKVGLKGTEHKYLDLLLQEGAMTAGRLAELSGLTTGAVTGIIDRLEKQGLVNRENDPYDRRKVLVVPDAKKAMEKMGPVFHLLHTDLMTMYDGFTDEELKVILQFLTDTTGFLNHKIRQLRSAT